MILEIHGGPYASYGPEFSVDYQLYGAAGYAVLFTNPGGSTGNDRRSRKLPEPNAFSNLAVVGRQQQRFIQC